MRYLKIAFSILLITGTMASAQTRPHWRNIAHRPAGAVVESYGAVGDGITDDTAAIQAAIDDNYIVSGEGTYYCATSLNIPATGTTLVLNRLVISAPVVFEKGQDCFFGVRHFSVTNDFPVGGNMLECGVIGDTTAYYNFRAEIDYATGKSPDTTVRANVVRNYNCAFSSWNISRAINTKNVYTCDAPAVNLSDNRIHGNIIENADYGMYLYGLTAGTHVEHHILDYNFIAGCKYGAVYAREEAHYQTLRAACDFNGQSLIRLTLASTPSQAIGDTVTGSVTGAVGVVTAIINLDVLVAETSGTFTTSDSVDGIAVTATVDYKTGGPYLDFISQANAGFSRHTLDCAFLTNTFINNSEDCLIFFAYSSSAERASIAGQRFFAGANEQYTELRKSVYSLRYGGYKLVDIASQTAAIRNSNGVTVLNTLADVFIAKDGIGNTILDWNATDGLRLGTWTGTQAVKLSRNLTFVGSAWDGPHPILGTYHIWVDSTGDLRIKNGQPTGDTDGTIVGTQS